MEQLISQHLPIWTTTQEEPKSGKGRGRQSNRQSPYGIKKLRELILELAVRGKLVPQDPKDESASALLEKITKEKARLIKEKKIKKQKKLPEISEKEKPFDLPKGWVWARLGSISQINPRNEAQDSTPVSFIPMPLVSTCHTGKHGQEIKKWGEIKKGYTHFANGDIGVAKITPCFENSKAAVFSGLESGIGAGTTELHIARPFGSTLEPRYILLFLKAPIFLHVGETKMTGTAGQKRVPKDFFSHAPLPLPPLAEQQRIVAKVDELMALCDQLEEQQESSQETHQTLVETLLASLTNGATPEECVAAWQRLATHFNTLFTTDHSITLLKQTILQLAVTGKLVPQNSTDEPASVLLERIAKEKTRFIKEGKIKKQKQLPEISEEEKPFALPQGWEFAQFDILMDITSGVTKGRKLQGKTLVSVPYLRVANVQRNSLDLEVMKEIDLPEDELDKFTVQKQDLLITEGGDWDKVGRTAIWGGELSLVVHQNHVFKARRILHEQNEVWIEKCLNSPIARDYFAKSSKQTTNLASINKTQLRGAIIPIPPLAEQHRIVARVNELLALCDQLQNSLTNQHTTTRHLADVLVQQARA